MALASLRDWGSACYCNSNKPGNVINGTACGSRIAPWFKDKKIFSMTIDMFLMKLVII
jgi:hypothetical protein